MCLIFFMPQGASAIGRSSRQTIRMPRGDALCKNKNVIKS
jgi:hypothetical protein